MRELQNEAMEDLIADITAKLQLLKFTRSKTHGIVEKGNTQAMERQSDALRFMVVDIDALKLKVEQLKFKGGDEPEDVATWSHAVEEQIAEVDVEITFLEKSLEEVRSKADLQKREKELALMARAREEQLEFKRAQLELKPEYERKLEESRAGKISVKASHKM